MRDRDLIDSPPNGEQGVRRRPLGHAFLQPVNKLIALPVNFVLDVKNPLPLAPLTLLQIADACL
jgi:hypothetical protein